MSGENLINNPRGISDEDEIDCFLREILGPATGPEEPINVYGLRKYSLNPGPQKNRPMKSLQSI